MGNHPTTLRPTTDTAAVQYLSPDNNAPEGYESVLDYAMAHEKVVGFFGDEGVKLFDSLMDDGSLSRHGAMPPGLIDLLGPILQSLDGKEFETTKAALVKALSGSQLEVYKSTIRSIINDEHHRWVARGGVISLAKLSRELVFKVILAIVFGMDVQHDQSELRAQVDEFIQGMHQSLAHVDNGAKKLREKLIESLVAPSLASARNRVAQGKTKPCVVDVLVSERQLDEQVLRVHVFHLFVNGFSGIDSMVVNSITAMCLNPQVHDQLMAARDAFAAKYTSVDDRWNHLDDLGYIQRFLKEVTRFYVEGTTHLYGRATRNVQVVVGKHNSFDLHKGAFATAILDSPTWTNASKFDPDRFLKQEHIELFPRTIDEHVKTLIVQSAFLSLLDFEWKMLPLQDYTVGPPHGTPVGGLMAVNFRHRNGHDGQLFEVAGTRADWTFLALPEAKVYRDDIESFHGFFTDSRLDLWTHMMLQLLQVKQTGWSTPKASTALKIPKYQKVLPKINLKGTNIMVPTEDEDTPLDPWYEKALMVLLRDTLPICDNFTDNWLPGEDMEAYVMSKVGKMWPRVLVHWNDRYSDRALQLLVFNGFAQHMVEKLAEPHDDGSYYAVLLDFMQVLEVREGYAKYGADAFFDKHGKVVKIVRGGKTFHPDDIEWEYVKFCFRSSLNTKVTAIDHLLGIHSTVANYLTTANREQLPVDHPLRRLIKPFTFRSVVINYAAAWALFWPKGMLHRGFALTEDGMNQVWDYGLKQFQFRTFPELVAHQNIDTLKIPFHEDGMDYWTVVHQFVSDYIDLYYSSDAEVTADASIQNFWDFLDKLPGSFPTLSLANLKDVLAQSIVWVSAMHNHLGTLAEYVSDPAFCGSAWVEGEAANRPGSAVRNALIMAATGFKQPSILEDFSHIMLDDRAKDVCHAFIDALDNLVDVIDARNQTREQKYMSFNPSTIEMAVSI
ncbi:unnamed protein product [Aphanomyces euteiches]|uniref:Lipoxygenase domain-containing protein n=1 Tax=Aphanomyces euteiches TaxID=100861 RepID=A0A6G0WB53_9STRA|nr:hypothetical protein Ae201684_017621 [Aphanomyces euteiches]KAH9076017.1 hypothetical protein Ae201684P_012507 [Aphanomyces euteiches]KAH9144692.1 hypothetical protein AeRB84_011380 [Aphanomyces euteiches]